MSINLDNQRVGIREDSTGAEPAADSGNDTEELSRQEAITQIKRKRKFHAGLAVSGIGIAFLVLIWATTEYHNAGGWPTQGFSQSSGIHDVWNYWIIYPVGAWVLIMAGIAWSVYRHRGITESEIQREMDRRTRGR